MWEVDLGGQTKVLEKVDHKSNRRYAVGIIIAVETEFFAVLNGRDDPFYATLHIGKEKRVREMFKLGIEEPVSLCGVSDASPVKYPGGKVRNTKAFSNGAHGCLENRCIIAIPEPFRAWQIISHGRPRQYCLCLDICIA
ncbi:MAG: hypothetical protein A4E63_02194 [Syntrophorhabdus sp. PtaU1.Bin050]|nr:MAG: hypothetical protein A4E63_02194 [Syntrophorhabdus sp. PtaU1.Bin050]